MGYKIYAPKPIYDEGMQALKDMCCGGGFAALNRTPWLSAE